MRFRPFWLDILRLSLLLSFLLPLLACNLASGVFPTATLPPTVVPSASPLPPTATPTSTPSPTSFSTATPTHFPFALPNDVALLTSSVRFHPDPFVVQGDWVGAEVQPYVPSDRMAAIRGLKVNVYLGSDTQAAPIAQGKIEYFGFAGNLQATLYNLLPTTDLIGEQTFTFWLDPDDELQEGDENAENNVLTVTLDILPSQQKPAREVGMNWIMRETECCYLLYLSGTAAERDIEQIETLANDTVKRAEIAMQSTAPEKIRLTLLDKVWGQGGFANKDGIAVTYIDRDYTGDELVQVLHHEVIHDMDNYVKPSMLTEGLAVYLTGGHYKSEPLTERAAAALRLGLFIPLPVLVENFYDHQHEIGYLEGAAFLEWLVALYGKEKMFEFLGNFPQNGSDLRRLDTALQETFGMGVAEADSAWQAYLQAVEVSPRWQADLQNTLALLDTARRYQERFVPSAHFAIAWTPPLKESQENQRIADFTRIPNQAENVTIELLLSTAGKAIYAGDEAQAQAYLDAANTVLDTAQGTDIRTLDFSANWLAQQTYQIVQALLVENLEVQALIMQDGKALVTVTDRSDWGTLRELVVSLD
ncbi:MAG TPA: hypothetical protein PK299_07225 [Anaerolineales bacterium]|nr:hypothetical protein [Anaerolineales bacterium]